jgi:hypothetical protein
VIAAEKVHFKLLKKHEDDVPIAAAEFLRSEVFSEYRKGIDERCSIHQKQITALESRQKAIDQKITATLVFVICSLVSILTAIGMGAFH